MKTGAEMLIHYYTRQCADGKLTEEQLEQLVTDGKVSEEEREKILSGGSSDAQLQKYYEMTQEILPKEG